MHAERLARRQRPLTGGLTALVRTGPPGVPSVFAQWSCRRSAPRARTSPARAASRRGGRRRRSSRSRGPRSMQPSPAATVQYGVSCWRTITRPGRVASRSKPFGAGGRQARGPGDGRLGSRDLPDPPVRRLVHRLEERQALEQQLALRGGGEVQRRVGERDPADRVLAQPVAVRVRRQRLIGVVEQRVDLAVELAVPAARERIVLGEVRRLPVVAGERHLEPLARLARGRAGSRAPPAWNAACVDGSPRASSTARTAGSHCR